MVCALFGHQNSMIVGVFLVISCGQSVSASVLRSLGMDRFDPTSSLMQGLQSEISDIFSSKESMLVDGLQWQRCNSSAGTSADTAPSCLASTGEWNETQITAKPVTSLSAQATTRPAMLPVAEILAVRLDLLLQDGCGAGVGRWCRQAASGPSSARLADSKELRPVTIMFREHNAARTVSSIEDTAQPSLVKSLKPFLY
mmetsp:Transcript_8535/g.14666  ORF Transcript_8535/g.14666 Transcript_8535/m.14666 type:complete len:199 (-) Transcript_8535:50-646(-)